MATTMRQIAKFLDNRRWQYMVDEDNFRVLTSVEANHVEQFVIVIQLHEDGKFLQFYVPRLLGDAQKYQHQESICHKLLALSGNTKMLQRESDLINEEVRAAIKFPLEAAPLNEKQFNHCLSSLINMVDQGLMPQIKAMMATSLNSGERELGEQMLLMLQEIAPEGILELLESALTAHQSQGSLASI